MRDFSAAKYRTLCEALVTSGYHSMKFADYCRGQANISLTDKRVILRHDVDRFARMALPLAEIERAAGLVATYYFRIPATWNIDVIRRIAELGHEVGLHYESMDKGRGLGVAAAASFSQDLALMRSYFDVRTVAMHGNPATPFDNRDLFNHISLEDYGLNGEAYLTVDFQKLLYYSDTGRTWAEGQHNLFDHPPTTAAVISDRPLASHTDHLITIVNRENRNLYIVTHPERWPVSWPGWMAAATKDGVVNILKAAIRRMRGR